MDATRWSTVGVLVLLASCAMPPATQTLASHEARRLPDGRIDITVTGRSERLSSSSGSVSLELTDILKKAAATECGGEFELEQDRQPTAKVVGGRLVATLHGVATCK